MTNLSIHSQCSFWGAKMDSVGSKSPKMKQMTLSLMQLSVTDGQICYRLPFDHNPERKKLYVISGFPILAWSSGMFWDEANAWFSYQAQGIPISSIKLATIQNNGYGLLSFMKFLEIHDLDWDYLPIVSAERAINRYRGHLIYMRDEGVLSPSTVSARMAVILRFYRWAQHHNILGGSQFEKITCKIIRVRDQFGRMARAPLSFSNLSIPNRKRTVDVVEGGLIPLEIADRDLLLDFAATNACTELYLMLKVAFFTGLRIDSICDLKLNSLEWAYPDNNNKLYWVNVGPNVKGAPVKTKFSVNGRVLISKDLLDELKTYSKSMRRLLREGKAHGSDKHLLFINKNGRTYCRIDGISSSSINGMISKLKKKALHNHLDISDFHMHRARATFGTSVVLAGLALVPKIHISTVISFARDLLLHKDEVATMTYIKFIQNREIKAAFADEYTRELIGSFAMGNYNE